MFPLQIVSCAKCRYQYELVSGNIVGIQSEEIRLVSHFIHYLIFFHLSIIKKSKLFKFDWHASMLFNDFFSFN